MASTYSTNLALELIGTGDQAGTWGNTTNTNLGTLIEQAISGYVTQAVSTGATTTITIPNGATGVARNMYIELTGTGGTNTVLEVPANKKLYFIYNNASGAVTVKVSGQTGVSVAAGQKVILVSNGTDVVEATSYLTAVPASVSITTLTATSATITNLTSTSATISSALTLSGGTANGVAYLDGSKVVTSGSTLVFDGTNLRVGGSGSGSRLVVRGTGTTSATFSIEAATSGGATRFLVADDGLCRWYGTSNAETMRLDNAGNLGLGVTPSAWTGFNVFQAARGSVAATTAEIDVSHNAYYDGAWKYIANDFATNHYQASGAYVWRTAPSGTAGNTISFTTAMTLDASGNLGIAEGNNPTQALSLYRSGSTNCLMSAGNSNTGVNGSLFGVDGTGNAVVNNTQNFAVLFSTNNTERARITTTGNLLVGTTTDVSGRSGVISDVSGNVRAIPRTGSAKTSVYTLTVSDVGQFVELGTGGGIDVPNGVFSTGDVVSVFNNTTGARTISLTITTAYIGGTDADKASVSLATRGVATILFISNSVCVVNGNVS